MPRKSADALAVVTPIHHTAIAPPREASPEIAALFREIVARVPADHFRPGDAPLIEAYAQAIHLGRQAYEAVQREGPVIAGRANPWVAVLEKAHRSSVALSARLRLSPQHRADPKTVARATGPLPSAYGIMRGTPDD